MEINFFKVKNFQTCLRSQSGVSLIIAFFVMIILLAVILAITTLLYQEIKMIRNIGNSVVAFYAADSGIEKVLYYDRKVILDGNTRGLCTMFDYNIDTNPNGCPQFGDSEGSGITDNALFCNKDGTTDFLTPNDTEGTGCNPDICNNCTISFKTNFDTTDKEYSVTAKVLPAATEADENAFSNFIIDSLGTYNSLTRKVELYMTKTAVEDLFTVYYAYVDPWSTPAGSGVTVEVKAKASKGISKIHACIKESYNTTDCLGTIDVFSRVGMVYTGTWNSSAEDVGAYYVDITITDTADNVYPLNNI
jgi:hypothetical protein